MRTELPFPMTAAEIAEACGANLTEGGDRVIGAITTDSRLVRAGDMFVALRGARSDGHLFLPDAAERGATLLLSERPSAGSVTVADTRAALSSIAAHSLQKHRIPVVAITGSVGKTGTKEAVAAALGAQLRVHKTAENENNELGVAFTLLSRPASANLLVLEFGTNSPGEIAAHANCAPPDVAILTAIGSAHIGAFGSREAILAEKSALIAKMREGLIVLNGDDPYLAKLSPCVPTLRAGLTPGLSLSASRISYSRYGTSYTLIGCEKERRVFLRSAGRPHVYTSLFAIATARHFGVPLPAALDALFRMPQAAGRQSISDACGVLLIDDAYNASPESMVAALELLSSLGHRRRKIAVLGDMLELGQDACRLHRELGRLAAEQADLLFPFGEMAEEICTGALEMGMPPVAICPTRTAELCCRALMPTLTDGDVVLVKASHALGGLTIADCIRTRGH